MGENGHGMVLKHMLIYYMYVIKVMEMYVGKNGHHVGSSVLKLKPNNFYIHTSIWIRKLFHQAIIISENPLRKLYVKSNQELNQGQLCRPIEKVIGK